MQGQRFDQFQGYLFTKMKKIRAKILKKDSRMAECKQMENVLLPNGRVGSITLDLKYLK